MTKITLREKLKLLNEHASPGKWCQFHPSYCEEAQPRKLKDGTWQETEPHKFDNSHFSSAISIEKDNSVYRSKVAEWHHSDDGSFADELVNAYRRGQLFTIEDVEEIVDKLLRMPVEAPDINPNNYSSSWQRRRGFQLGLAARSKRTRKLLHKLKVEVNARIHRY
jgi:hypothetical protein